MYPLNVDMRMYICMSTYDLDNIYSIVWFRGGKVGFVIQQRNKWYTPLLYTTGRLLKLACERMIIDRSYWPLKGRC